MVRVRFEAAGRSFDGTLKDQAIGNAIAQQLPLVATAKRWGDEIYFDVPVKMSNTRPTLHVKIGDLAYWPEGPCLCIFFGKTPASKGQEPRPASDVTVVGHTDTPAAFLRSIKDGTAITVEHAGPPQDQTV
jgi:hypothetical protein